MRRSRFVAVLGALACAGCNDVPAAQNVATVYGRVYDAGTNAGLAGVSVSADVAIVAVTAADGTFSLAPVPPGQTDVIVTPPPGYALETQPAAFSVAGGDRFRLDIALVRS